MVGTLMRLLREVDRRLRTKLDFGLDMNELAILGQIDRGIHLPSTISRSLRFDPARVTRTVDRLVGLGQVERGTDAVDRRRCPLVLTERGRQTVQAGRMEIARAMDAILREVPEDQRHGLTDALESVRNVIDKMPAV